MPMKNIIYEKKQEGAVIWRCCGEDKVVELPEQIGELSVTEIAPYAFSCHMEEDIIIEGIRTGRLLSFGEAWSPQDPAICGKGLEKLLLPSGMRKVGAYAFYNCDALEVLHFPGSLSDWGAGAFTGCHHVRELEVCLTGDETSSLKEVLAELKEELCLHYRSGEHYARLLFPEFFEEGVENTPARILETHVHGSGLYYRNCFQQKRFDFQEYDSRFPYAAAQESEEFLLQMAEGRLRFPWRLAGEAKKVYQDYLFSHGRTAVLLKIQARDVKGLQWLAEYLPEEAFPMEEALEGAVANGFLEGVSDLMSRQRFRKKKQKADPFTL